jgi:hypothetical protein
MAANLFSKLNEKLGEAVCLMAQCYLLNIDKSPADLSKNSGHKSFKEMLLVADQAFDGLANKEKSVES